MCVCISMHNIHILFVVYILYTCMHTPHLFSLSLHCWEGHVFSADSGGPWGWCVALPPCPPSDAQQSPLGLALCPLDEKCLIKSFVAHRCVLNTYIHVAASLGAGGAVQAERQAILSFPCS